MATVTACMRQNVLKCNEIDAENFVKRIFYSEAHLTLFQR
jgi:hypothetical protein